MSTHTEILSLAHALREVRLVPSLRKEVDDLESRRREWEQAAYNRGRRDAEQQFQEQLRHHREELNEIQRRVLDPIHDALPRVARESEEALISLCLVVAQKLVAGLPISAEMIEAAVRESVAQLGEATEHHIHLHPDDIELLQHAGSPLLAPGTNGQRLHFHRDPAVTRGGCIVKSRFGVHDARRETKTEMLRKTLLP